MNEKITPQENDLNLDDETVVFVVLRFAPSVKIVEDDGDLTGIKGFNNPHAPG